MNQHLHRAPVAAPSDVAAPTPAGRATGWWPPHRIARGALAVGLVLALSGLMFTVNARASADGGSRHPQNLAELSQQEAATVERLSSEVDTLRAAVERLTEQQNAAAGLTPEPPTAGQLVAGGTVPVTGPGLTVVLDDAPVESRRTDVNPDLLVVHQQDLQSVMNALWAGGAEAMGLMDQRVIATSAFRCVGNVLRLHGRIYSPPYVVQVVGDPVRLRAALAASPAVAGYVRDAGDLGLGWSVQDQSTVELPAYSGATELTWADVPDGVDVLPGLPADEETT